jgi:aromatic ring hydroxylase
MRTSAEYRESLRDGRRVIYRGSVVDDVTAHAALRRTIDHSAALWDYQAAGSDEFWRYHDTELGEVSTYFLRPTDAESLRLRGDLIEETTRLGRSTFNIAKAVGTDALLGLEQATLVIDAAERTQYYARVSEFRAHCARLDLAMALAATDSKGDRTLPPNEQTDPDMYLRIVDRDSVGITVRGAKLHTTASPSANELIVIPCRAMGPGDSDYAVAFAVPLNTEGLTLVCHPLAGGAVEENPVSARNIEIETLTVFADVRIPWDRVFLCGEWRHAGLVATAFANYHRYTALSYKPPLIDLMIGAAALAADQLGLGRSSVVREKLGRLIVYGELIRAARLAAAVQCSVDPSGLAVPYSVAANAGKYHFASGFHQAVAILQDIAGGLVATAPGFEDLEDPEVGQLVNKYLSGRAGVSGRERWELAALIRDLTASDFGGYNYVATLHGEGSLSAQLVQAVRDYEVTRCVDYAKEILASARTFATPVQ